MPVTPAPSAEALGILRSRVANEVAETYPGFAKAQWGV